MLEGGGRRLWGLDHEPELVLLAAWDSTRRFSIAGGRLAGTRRRWGLIGLINEKGINGGCQRDRANGSDNEPCRDCSSNRHETAPTFIFSALIGLDGVGPGLFSGWSLPSRGIGVEPFGPIGLNY